MTAAVANVGFCANVTALTAQETIANAGDLLIVVTLTTGTVASNYVSSITDDAGITANTWTGLFGAINTSACVKSVGSALMGVFIATAAGAGGGAGHNITVALAANPSTRMCTFIDVTGAAASSPIQGVKGNSQSVTSGTNNITIAGGTNLYGSNDSATLPCYALMLSHAGAGTIGAGNLTGIGYAPTPELHLQGGELASAGVFDGTASVNATTTAWSIQLLISEAVPANIRTANLSFAVSPSIAF